MAKVKLPLSASSSIADFEINAEPIGITPFANQGITSEEAPVLLTLASEKTIGIEEFSVKMVKTGGQGTQAQARLFLNGTLAVIEDLVDEYGAITVQTPMGTIETFIAGTVENPQDQPDPAKNYAFLAVVVPETYRKLFAKIETYVPTGVCPATLKRVRDKATNAKGICGVKPFYLEGRGMTIGAAGEKLELLSPLTFVKVADAAVDAASKSLIQFLCTLSASATVAAGPYVLRLTTLAGGEVAWPIDLEVNLLEAVEPTPIAESADGQVKVYKVAPATGTEFNVGENVKVTGVNLGREGSPVTGIVEAYYTLPGDKRFTFTVPTVPLASTELTLTADDEPVKGLPVGEYDANLVLDRAKQGTPSDTLTIPLKVKITEYIPEE